MTAWHVKLYLAALVALLAMDLVWGTVLSLVIGSAGYLAGKWLS